MILYKDEFKVATKSVTVSSGSTVSSSIASTEETRTTVWRIGEFDGRPVGFRNAANQLRMHPSDTRMSSWGPLTFTVGGSIGKCTLFLRLFSKSSIPLGGYFTY